MSNFFKITAKKDNCAEIELSGEICSTRPIDMWTWEKAEGDFIAFDEFKASLKEISDKKHITIKLNSFGGDLFAGKAIYDALKNLKAKKTVQIMGVSASASTIVMLAGDKIVANDGDLIMIHEARCAACDNFDAESAQRIVNTLTACNNAMAELYSAKTGKDKEEILKAMHEETWFTAKEAKEFGLIDEVIESAVKPKLSASADGKLYVGANLYNLRGIKIPDNIRQLLPTMQEQSSTVNTDDNITTIKGASTMSEKVETIDTLEKLQSAYPDMIKAFRESVITAERKRIQEIEEIESSLVLDKEAILNAKFGIEAKDARDLAFMNAQAQAKIGAAELNKLKSDTVASGANNVAVSGNAGTAKKDNGLSAGQKAFVDVTAVLDKMLLR